MLYSSHTFWLTPTIPGISVRVPVRFILPPVIVVCPTATAVVSVIVISAVRKHFMFRQKYNNLTLKFQLARCWQSPVCSIPWVTSQVLVSALWATVAIVVTRVATRPRLSTWIPAITAVPRLASITTINGWAGPRPRVFVTVTAIRGPERKVIN